MSALDEVMKSLGRKITQQHAEDLKQSFKDLVLEIIEDCDPSKEDRDPASIYWGNTLRKKVEEL